MNADEIRMRCIEAAAKAPIVHQNGPAAGVIAVAQAWEQYITGAAVPQATRPVLGVPRK